MEAPSRVRISMETADDMDELIGACRASSGVPMEIMFQAFCIPVHKLVEFIDAVTTNNLCNVCELYFNGALYMSEEHPGVTRAAQAHALAHLLRTCRTITHLTIVMGSFWDGSLEPIMDAIASPSASVTHLRMRNIVAYDRAATADTTGWTMSAAVQAMLSSNTSLVLLELTCATLRLHHDGARALCAGLAANRTLRHLTLYGDGADRYLGTTDMLCTHYERNYMLDTLIIIGNISCSVLRERTLAISSAHMKQREVIKLRTMCQAGRACANVAQSDLMAWLCQRAPLWVVVRVCELLRP